MKRRLLLGSVCLAAMVASGPAFAQSANVSDQIKALQAQIKQQQDMLQTQQQQLKSLVEQVNSSQVQAKQANDTAKAAEAKVETVQKQVPAAAAAGPTVTMSPTNRPGWRSADGRNSIELTGLLQFDYGAQGFHPSTTTQALTKLQSGVNTRRAQIGFNAKFMDDWGVDFNYDFGNSSENIDPTKSTGGISAGFKTARMSYRGFKPFDSQMQLEWGYETPPTQLDDAMSSSAYPFIEHPTPERLASSVAAGNARSVVGARDYTDRFFGFVAFSGPKAGDPHIAAPSTATATGATPSAGGSGSEQIAVITRFVYAPLMDGADQLHIGGGFSKILQPTYKSFGGGTANFNSATLSDETELRVDPTNVTSISLGTLANPLSSITVYEGELSGQYGRIYGAGEYFHWDVERVGLRDVQMDGGYGELFYSITGEQHRYVPSSAAYANLSPLHPVSLSRGGMGAWEVGARYSVMFANPLWTSGVKTQDVAAVNGGVGQDFTLGVNWYATDNVRIQFNGLHGFLNNAANGGHWNTLALRTQMAF